MHSILIHIERRGGNGETSTYIPYDEYTSSMLRHLVNNK